MIIAVDFDGTIVEHKYPKIGKEVPFAIDTLKLLQRDHHRIILWTIREGDLLKEAVAWCAKRGLTFYAVNANSPDEDIHDNNYSRKINADIFIDDLNLGGMVDWGTAYRMIRDHLTFENVVPEETTKQKRWNLSDLFK